MDKIRSKPSFRKERSLQFIFSVMIVFIIVTALIHKFYNPGIVETKIISKEQVSLFGSIENYGTRLEFAKVPTDTSYHQSVTVELLTRNEPDSLFIWQDGTRVTADKIAENKFIIDLVRYSEMVVSFAK